MMFVRIKWVRATLCALSTASAVLGSIAGCGSDGGNSGSGGVSPGTCYRQCDAQSAIVGCMPIVDPPNCKALCDALAAGTPASCQSKFDAYYECSANAGFECFGDLEAQKGGACLTEEKAYVACQNGGHPITCEGALDGGFCPSVDCPCPSGVTPISGFDNGPSGCRCFDTTSCKTLCD